MVEIMTVEEWEKEQGYSSEGSYSSPKEEHRCECGKAVCCGKHKGCPHKKNRIRFVKRRD